MKSRSGRTIATTRFDLDIQIPTGTPMIALKSTAVVIILNVVIASCQYPVSPINMNATPTKTATLQPEMRQPITAITAMTRGHGNHRRKSSIPSSTAATG